MNLLIVICIGVVVLVLTRVATKRKSVGPPPYRREPSAVALSVEPDAPVGFGRKNLWFAAPAPSSVAVAEALGLLELQPANWSSGVAAAYDFPSSRVFVTPPIAGWVLAVGVGVPDPSDPALLPRWREAMTSLSRAFGETQFFASHRVSSYTAWARYLRGSEKRLFAYADEPIYNLGEPFPEELPLVTNLFDPSSPDAEADNYWERKDLHLPDEDDPLRLAEKWSVSPERLEDRPELTGQLGLVGTFPAAGRQR